MWTETTAGAHAPLVRKFFGQHDLGLVPELVRELVTPQALRPGRLAERRARRLGVRQIRVTQKPKHLAQHVRGNSVEKHAGLVLLHHVLGGLRPHHASVRGPLPPGAGAHGARPARRVKLWRALPSRKSAATASARSRRRSRAFRGCASRITEYLILACLVVCKTSKVREFCADEKTRKVPNDIGYEKTLGYGEKNFKRANRTELCVSRRCGWEKRCRKKKVC